MSSFFQNPNNRKRPVNEYDESEKKKIYQISEFFPVSSSEISQLKPPLKQAQLQKKYKKLPYSRNIFENLPEQQTIRYNLAYLIVCLIILIFH